MSDPAAPTPHSTGGNVRWEPPSPAELEAQMPGYTIEKLLGRGGMGAVYKGVQSNLDRPVAIKILPPGVEQEDPSFAERFKNEARLMARLNNPAVVSVHDFGLTNGGLLYFAMEYVDGTDVSQMIRSQGKLPPEHALAITAHVCDALSAAHELGIVHRDIKPANVLINRKGQVKVADFGLAKVEEPGTHGLTKTGYAMGTPDFVAPEVLMLGSHIDGRADLYAVGVMLYQMLTGEVPRGAFKPATARLPGLDPRFDPIILKAMQSDREERYQSSTELRRDLDVILTVPLVRQDEPPTAAIPAAQVAQTPAQRSAAQKPVGKAPQPKNMTDTPVRRDAASADRSVRGTSQATKSSAPLLLGLGAMAAIGIGAFVMFSGSEKAKPSGPLSPLSGTSAPSTPETTKISSPPSSTQPQWQKVEWTDRELQGGKTSRSDGGLLISPSAALHFPAAIVQGTDYAVRCKTKVSKDLGSPKWTINLHDRMAVWFMAIAGGTLNVKAPKDRTVFSQLLSPTVADDEEIVVEHAVIGRKQLFRINRRQFGTAEAPEPADRRGYMSQAGTQKAAWLKDVEYMNLDGVVNPEAFLGWNIPATSAAPVASISNTPAASQTKLSSTTLSPATSSTTATSNWQRVERTEARWKELGFELKDGWVSFLNAPGGESQKAWVISNDIKGKIPRDVAVRIRFRKEKVGHVSLTCRYNTAKPLPEAIFWGDGRSQVRIQNRPPGATPDMQEVKPPKPPAVGEEGVLELAVIGSRVIARLNSSTVLEREVSGMHPAGPFEVRSGGHWIKDAEYMNLEGVADPIKALGWNVPAASPAAVAAPTPPPSTPVSPSPSLPASSSPPPATVMAAAVPASELDQRLAAIESGFQAAVERDANAAFKASMAALDKSYLGALDRALGAATSGGKLEDALALRAEKQRIEKGEGVPSEVDESTQAAGKVPETLKTLRKTYRSTVAQHEATKLKAMQPLYDKYDQALAAVQTELTQAQKLDDALRVKAVREQIAATRSGAEVSAGNPARTTSTAGAAAPMTEADKSARAPLASTLAIKDGFTNSLGMKFVPVPGTDVVMCIHETRRQDYAAYAADATGVDATWKNFLHQGFPVGNEDNHPVAGVSWDDAVAFCTWLSQKEGRPYRLPTDQEWSFAVGIGREEKGIKNTTPELLSQQVKNQWPWGNDFPPKTKDKAGNYADMTRKQKLPALPAFDAYTDGHITTAPVMSFTPNKLGIYDLGGNMWEWVADWYSGAQTERTLRGSAFGESANFGLLSSYRHHSPPTTHGVHGFRVVVETHSPASASVSTKPGAPPPPAAPAPAPATAAKNDFTNSLGMPFVKISGTKVLFCIHETRYKDYAAYAAAVPTLNPRWKNQNLKNVAPKGPTDDHPVVIVSWEDAQAFCAWLSQKEGKRYRLPTDEEWSYAAGIGRDEKRKKGDTPSMIASVPNEYPWGTKWPPSKGCENYGDESYKAAVGVPKCLAGYDDGYPTTAPVMSFKPNRYGLYDMGGNVSEWCEDWLNNTQTSRVLRGSGWKGGVNDFELLLSHRGQAGVTVREDAFGFRIVLETTE